MTAFGDLELACIANVLSRLGPDDCGRAACVASLWRAAVADDVLWRRHLRADFAASECAGPGDAPAASYKCVTNSSGQQMDTKTKVLGVVAAGLWCAPTGWAGRGST